MPRRHRVQAFGAPVLALLAVLHAAAPALAQGELRSITVPAEGGVVIPPRGVPRLTARPGGAGIPMPLRPGGTGPVILPDTGTGLAAPLLGLVLPALAGAVLGGTIAGGKGGGSAPARTR